MGLLLSIKFRAADPAWRDEGTQPLAFPLLSRFQVSGVREKLASGAACE